MCNNYSTQEIKNPQNSKANCRINNYNNIDKLVAY